MLDKLEAIKARFDDLGVALTNPEVVNNNKKFSQLSKEYRSLERIVNAYHDYKKLLDDIDFYKEALHGDDDELRELAKAEAPGLEERKEFLEKISLKQRHFVEAFLRSIKGVLYFFLKDRQSDL